MTAQRRGDRAHLIGIEPIEAMSRFEFLGVFGNLATDTP
jgi:hypothetical protein